MTRLRESDINHIARQLGDYDRRLTRITGASLWQIACNGAGVEGAQLSDLLDRVHIAAVPIRSGLGVISGFSSAVAAIASHLGFVSFVTEGYDVVGIAEAIEKGADILMLADDDRFVAIAPGSTLVVDNIAATAQGFVAGLELMNRGIAGEPVLVLGCGPVGLAATKALIDRGAQVGLCDVEKERALAALKKIGEHAKHRIRVEDNCIVALRRYDLIFDATNADHFIGASNLNSQAKVAAPGMPCALTQEAMTEYRNHVIHDALEIGTATMAVQAAASVITRRDAEKVIEA